MSVPPRSRSRKVLVVIVLVVALAGLTALAVQWRRTVAARAMHNGFQPEDIIGWCDGDPIVISGTRSVDSIMTPEFVEPCDPRFGKDEPATYSDDEPVMGLYANGVAKAYSTWFLNSRELVHDTVGGLPLLISW